jgi:hypothetical protein
MDEIENVIKTLNETEKVLGVLIVITLCVTVYLIFRWLDKSVEKMAKETSDKSLAKFQITLDNRLYTQVRLFCRTQ